MTDLDEVDIGDLCFTARALAQTHPMSQPALRYRQRRFEEERTRQHVPELADWASTALLVGYCLRRAEEQAAPDRLPETDLHTPDDYESAAGGLAEALRVGDANEIAILPAPTTVAALDRLIATELDKRHEHVREQLDDAAWTELEDYIAWWVVHGYAVRATELPKR